MLRRILTILFLVTLPLWAASAWGAECRDRELFSVDIGYKSGFIDETGELVIPAIYDYAGYFHEGRAVVRIGDKYGFIDTDGNYIHQPKFDGAERFYDGLAEVRIKGKTGFIDLEGNMAIEPRLVTTMHFMDGLACASEDELYGFIRPDGSWAIEPRFKSMTWFRGGRAWVWKGNRAFWIDKQGNENPRTNFPFIGEFSEGLAPFCLKPKPENHPAPESGQGPVWGYIDESGKVMIPAGFHWADSFERGFARVRTIPGNSRLCDAWIDHAGNLVSEDKVPRGEFKDELARVLVNKRWGYMNSDGGIAIEPQFRRAEDFENGRAAVALKDGCDWWAIDTEGTLLFKFNSDKYLDPYDVYRAGANVWRARYFDPIAGIIDRQGSLIHFGNYEDRRPFSEGVAIARTSRQTMFHAPEEHVIIDRHGALHKPDYEGKLRWKCSDGLILSQNYSSTGDEFAYLDRTGELVLGPFKGNGGDFINGRASVEIGGVYWFIDRSGNKQTQLPGYVPTYSDELIRFWDGKAYGFCDLDGNIIYEAIYQSANDFSDGMATVKLDEKWGAISRRGIMLIQPRFDYLGPFNDGLAVFAEDEKYGYVNRMGIVVIPAEYDEAEPFSEGVALVMREVPDDRPGRDETHEEYFFIDRRGRNIFNRTFKAAKSFSEGLAPVCVSSGSWEYIDLEGTVVTNLDLRGAEPFSDGRAWVWLQYPIVFFDLEGNVIWETPYEVNQ